MSQQRKPRFRIGYIVSRIHKALYILLRGRFVSGRGNVSFLLLSTKGRRTQRIRTVPLLHLTHHGDPCVIASKGGSPLAPDWLLNIRAEPEVMVQIGGVRWDGTARVASEGERAGLWPVILPLESLRIDVDTVEDLGHLLARNPQLLAQEATL